MNKFDRHFFFIDNFGIIFKTKTKLFNSKKKNNKNTIITKKKIVFWINFICVSEKNYIFFIIIIVHENRCKTIKFQLPCIEHYFQQLYLYIKYLYV